MLTTGCASTSPVISPPCPGPVTVYVRDTVKILQQPTITYVHDTTVVAKLVRTDSTAKTLLFNPLSAGGDSYPMLQAAVDFCIVNPGYRIHLNAGDFHISHPLIVAKVYGADYGTVAIDLEGSVNAKNTNQAYTTNIFADFTDGFCIGLQLNKGTQIRNIHFGGRFAFPNTLGAVQVDTLRAEQWTDGICRDNRTSPYAAIVIDPFGDPATFTGSYQMYPGLESYYLPGMSRNGSTAINISGCSIYDFVVGVLVTGGFQYNGELINLSDSRIDNCKVCYAYSQAQSKANTVTDLMVWGGVRTIFDGLNYGFGHNDASTAPFIDVMNIAGNVYQLFDVFASTFPLSAKMVYAESMFKIGTVRGLAGAHFDDFQIDFPHAGGGVPSPDFIYQGTNTLWTACMLRLYNGQPSRLILDCPDNTFIGGSMNAPPVVWNTSNQLATFQNVGMQYTGAPSLNTNNYDWQGAIDKTVIHVNRADFTGWYIASQIVSPGDLLVTGRPFEPPVQMITGSNYPVGVVNSISGDTVRLQNIGVGIHDGETILITNAKIK